MLQYKKIAVSEGIDVNKTSDQKNASSVNIVFFKKKIFKNMFVINVMIY